jgi:hypothetical protein
MSKPVTLPNTFANLSGTQQLVLFDQNFSPLSTAFNDLATYSNYFVDSSGAPNSISVTVPAPLTFAYTAGIRLEVKIGNTNTSGTVAINVNALGNVNVKNPDGSNPAVGQLVLGGVYQFEHDGTNFQILGGNGSGVTGLANPTATVGLAAINGVATTAMRSDAAPALSQAIVPTWTGVHTFNAQAASTVANQASNSGFYVNSTQPSFGLRNSAGAVDGKVWDLLSDTSATLALRAVNDGISAASNVLRATRSATAITDVSLGNATSNPTYSFLGTGAATFGGAGTFGGPVTVNTFAGYFFLNSTTATNAPLVRLERGGAERTRLGVEGTAGATIIGSAVDDTFLESLAGGLLLGVGNSTQIKIAVNNTVTINAPSGNSAFTTPTAGYSFGNATDNPTYAFAGTGIATFTGPIALGASSNILANATNGLTLANAANSVVLANLGNAGGMTVGAPTGGNKGAGTINATGLFVNNVAVSTGATTTGTFTGTFTGFTAANTGTCTWTLTGNTVTLFMPTNLAASNATTFTMTGLPAAIQPATLTQSVALTGDTQNNSTVVTGGAAVFSAASGTVTFHTGGGAANWAATGNKGWSVGASVTYSVQ